MPANYVLLEKITVGATPVQNVTFSGIPQTGYTDLVVKFSTRSNRAGIATAPLRLYPNGSSSGITLKYLQGSGTAVGSGTEAVFTGFLGEINAATSTASTFSNFEIYIPNYTSSNYKSISVDGVQENNATAAYSHLEGYLWSNTAAITSLQILDGLGNFVEGSTFYLYGVAKLGTTPAIVPYATGGDTIMTDGTYWYHTFLSSGTFTPAKAITCDYLVVAGGGGGGRDSYTDARRAGGGGAGGYRTSIGGSPLSLVTSAYTVTIGGGGAGATTANKGNGTNGSNSVFSSITSTGGGFGCGTAADGSITAAPVPNGGSGGGGTGGSGNNLANGNAGLFSPVEGYGGNDGGYSAPNYFGGGGGGSSANAPTGGVGGAGTANSISGSSVTYAGGGGGGGSAGFAGGTGGGGAGSSGAGTAGTANLGGGGGGSRNATGGAGGSGIVIVRYAV